MHNPSKMHMNFPSSNSSRLNSSQWINYEYCMHRSVGDQIEFTVKRKTKKQTSDIRISSPQKKRDFKMLFFKLWKKNIPKDVTFTAASFLAWRDGC